MYEFSYHRPASLQDAAEMFGQCDDGQYMAGGQTLIPVMKQRLAMPSDVIDLSGIDGIKGISVSDGVVGVGAMTRHAEVAASPEIRQRIPALAELAGHIGDPHVRNRGTLGGSIANNDPSADYPAALVGLGATVFTDRRRIAADDFFTDFFETALEEGELIARVEFPVPEAAGYAKFPNPASRYAVVGVMASRGADGIRVAVTGAGPCVFRAVEMEGALGNGFRLEALDGISVPADDLNDDMHASSEYRAHLVGVMARRAVAMAG